MGVVGLERKFKNEFTINPLMKYTMLSDQTISFLTQKEEGYFLDTHVLGLLVVHFFSEIYVQIQKLGCIVTSRNS